MRSPGHGAILGWLLMPHSGEAAAATAALRVVARVPASGSGAVLCGPSKPLADAPPIACLPAFVCHRLARRLAAEYGLWNGCVCAGAAAAAPGWAGSGPLNLQQTTQGVQQEHLLTATGLLEVCHRHCDGCTMQAAVPHTARHELCMYMAPAWQCPSLSNSTLLRWRSAASRCLDMFVFRVIDMGLRRHTPVEFGERAAALLMLGGPSGQQPVVQLRQLRRQVLGEPGRTKAMTSVVLTHLGEWSLKTEQWLGSRSTQRYRAAGIVVIDQGDASSKTSFGGLETNL